MIKTRLFLDINNRIKASILIFPLLAGGFLTLAFSLKAFWWVIFFALVPLFFFIQRCPSKKLAFWGGWACSFIFYGFLISYFFSSYPLDWAGIESRWGLLFIFLIWLVSALALALPFGFFGFSMKVALRNFGFFGGWTIPALWVIFEYLKSWSFGVFWFGPGALLGPHWSIGNLGYALSNNTILLQLAGWGGVYLLSFLIVLVNYLIFLAIRDLQNKKRFAKLFFLAITAVIAIMVVVLILGNWEVQKKDSLSEKNPRAIKVALLQTDFPSAFHEDFDSLRERLEAHLSLFEKIKKRNSDVQLIVMTDRTSFLKLLEKFFSKNEIQGLFADLDAVMTDIKPSRTQSGQSSLIFYYDLKNNQIISEQEKIMLLPGGEYSPYLLRIVAVLLDEEGWLEDFLLVRGYERGSELKVTELSFGKVGGLLCSEVLSPVLYRSLTNQGAEILINMASDSVFRGNPILLSQNLAMAKVRAVENNRYFLQATNAGYSYIIDNRGIIKSAGKEKGNEVIFGEAKLISQKSFYVKNGDWILIFSLFLIFGQILPRFLKNLS